MNPFYILIHPHFFKKRFPSFGTNLNIFLEVWFQARLSSFPTSLFATVGNSKLNFITSNSSVTIPKVMLSHNTSLHLNKTLAVVKTVQRQSLQNPSCLSSLSDMTK